MRRWSWLRYYARQGSPFPFIPLSLTFNGERLIVSGFIYCAIFPNLEIAFQVAFCECPPFFLEDILQGTCVVEEDLEVIANDVSVKARWTSDQNGAMVVALLRYMVR